MEFLLNNSLLIIFLVTASLLIYNEYRRFLKEKEITPSQLFEKLRHGVNRVGAEVLAKFLTALIVATIISVVSFRELFVMDIFHTVFLTMLLVRPVYTKLNSLLK